MAQARIFENLIQNLPARTARENFRNLPALAQNFNNFSKFACTLEIRGEKIGKICLRRCQKFACKKFACASKKILAWAKLRSDAPPGSDAPARGGTALCALARPASPPPACPGPSRPVPAPLCGSSLVRRVVQHGLSARCAKPAADQRGATGGARQRASRRQHRAVRRELCHTHLRRIARIGVCGRARSSLRSVV